MWLKYSPRYTPHNVLRSRQIINPHTGRRFNVTREFCAAPCYASIYKRLLRDTLRKNPSLIPILSSQAPGARVTAEAAEATAASAATAAANEQPAELASSPVPSAAPTGSATAAANAGGSGANGENPYMQHSPRRLVVSPVRSHPLPRGPGGIDILSAPPPPSPSPSPTREFESTLEEPPRTPLPRANTAVAMGVEHPAAAAAGSLLARREEGASAAVAAAAAMLGLGAGGVSGGGGGGAMGSARATPPTAVGRGDGSGASPVTVNNASGISRSSSLNGSMEDDKPPRQKTPSSDSSLAPTLNLREASANAMGHGGDGEGNHIPQLRCSPTPPMSPKSMERARHLAEEWNLRARAPPPVDVAEAGATAEAAHWQVGEALNCSGCFVCAQYGRST